MATALPLLAEIAVASALALPSSIIYLSSLDRGGADIPLAGGGIYLLSIVGLLIVFVAAGQTDSPQPVSRS